MGFSQDECNMVTVRSDRCKIASGVNHLSAALAGYAAGTNLSRFFQLRFDRDRHHRGYF
jgi:hypothetical protein